jgi:glycogen debranching enzyme
MKKFIIEECYQKSIELLLKNSTKFGVLASSKNILAGGRYYDSIFGRDAGICSLGMVLAGNQSLIKLAEKSLVNLAKFQSRNGEIPYYVKPEEGKSDFWYIGNIDSALWWLIAIKFFGQHVESAKLEKKLAKNITLAINWLEAQEHPRFFLLQQNEASDWADIMPRSGYVLYTNALWYWVKKLYKFDSAEKTKESFNHIFYPWQKIPKKYYLHVPRAKKLIEYTKKQVKKQDFFLSFVNYSFNGEDADVLGNCLAVLSGLTNQQMSRKLIVSFFKQTTDKTWPIPVLFKPIMKNSKLWREYMIEHNLNLPNQYHNGGIWPFASCFWAIALAKAGFKKEAWEELEKVAKFNKIKNWEFNEWFHSKTGKPMGMPGQSWNAGVFLLAYCYLKSDIKF